MTPKSQALAFRIWAYCEPLEWNVTIREIADGTRMSPFTVSNILRAKGWNSRVRCCIADSNRRRKHDAVQQLDTVMGGSGWVSDMTNYT